jgi:hypothetical protein
MARTEEIALFPLGLFLLPGDYTQLHIFEERYKQLISDCEATGMGFGISFTNKLNSDNFGCLVEITEVLKRYPNGELDVLVKATSIFKLQQFFYQKQNRLYPGGLVSHIDSLRNYRASDNLLLAFRQYVSTSNNPNSEFLTKENLGTFDIANELYMSDLEKLELINLIGYNQIDQYLINYIRYLELLQVQEKSVYKNIYLN